MFNWKKFISDFKKSQVVDDKERYKFRLSNPYLLYVGVFFTSIAVLATISLLNFIKNKHYIKMTVSIILIGYAVGALLKSFLYKIAIEKDHIKYGKYGKTTIKHEFKENQTYIIDVYADKSYIKAKLQDNEETE